MLLFHSLTFSCTKNKMITLPMNRFVLVNLKPDVCLNYYSLIGLGMTLAFFFLEETTDL